MDKSMALFGLFVIGVLLIIVGGFFMSTHKHSDYYITNIRLGFVIIIGGIFFCVPGLWSLWKVVLFAE